MDSCHCFRFEPNGTKPGNIILASAGNVTVVQFDSEARISSQQSSSFVRTKRCDGEGTFFKADNPDDNLNTSQSNS